MDGVSTVISLVENAIKLFKLVKSALNDVKDAPKELQALRGRVEDIELLLDELQSQHLDGLFQSNRDIQALQRHGRRAQECISDIADFMEEVERADDIKERIVRKIRWLRKRGRLDDLNERLTKLENALSFLVTLIVLYVIA